MFETVTSVRGALRSSATRCMLVGSFALMLSTVSAAQTTSTSTSATDGSTPVALTPGAPAGAYALSGFDNINPYNGNLNFALPLLHISGRGDAQYTMMLRIETHWRVVHTTQTTCLSGHCDPPQHFYHADYSWWNPLDPGYGPGILVGRAVGDSPTSGSGCVNNAYNTRTLTRLTFTAADGTEFELIDQSTLGQPKLNFSGCFNPLPRGTVFVTADGSSASFVSDTVINDNNIVSGPFYVYPSGYLMLRNGIRYRIDSGGVTWIRDRNGNMLNFATINGVYTITDSLGRMITVTNAKSDTNGLYDEIAFKGFGQAQRTIQVRRNNLGDTFPDGATVRRPGDSLTPASQLFQSVPNSSNTPVNPLLASAVVLPDGRQYRFRYNKYIELWRVELPTGGAFEYEHGPGLGADQWGVVFGTIPGSTAQEMDVYRRVTERRVYPDGVNVEGKMIYTEAATPDGNGTSVIADHRDPSGTTSLAKDEHWFFGQPRVSFFKLPTSYDPWKYGKEFTTKSYDKLNGPQLRQADNTWTQSSPSWWTDLADSAPSNNPVLTDVVSTLTDVTPNLASKQHYAYDQFFNKMLEEEYEFGTGAPGVKLRSTETAYVSGGNYTNPTADPTKNANLRSLPSSVTLKDGSGIPQAQTTFEYDNYTADAFHSSLTGRSGISSLDSGYVDPSTGTSRRGNVTKISKWVNTTGGTIDTYSQYDVAGNVVKVIDPRSTINNVIATTVDFSDDYGAPNGDARQNTAPTELGTQTSFAFPTKVTNAAGQIAYAQFDYYIGRPVDGEDANNVVTSGYYQDSLDRPTKIIRGSDPASSSLTNQTTFTYTPSVVGGSITTNSDKDANTDGLLTSTVLYDGLGRMTETQHVAPEGVIRSITTYDALGRAKRVTNPYRLTSEPTYGYADSTYDGLSRVMTVSTFDGTNTLTGTITTTYAGNATTVVDQALKQRRSYSDALGRLTSVDEMLESPSATVYATTNYQYDVLDDLTSVTQGTQPQRTFVYDSLKRLTSAFNPESGTINYTYDANSNLLTRQDARSIATTYFYDAVNRVTKRTYSDSTPEVDYYYDNQALPQTKPPNFTPSNSIGRLTAVCYGGVTSSAGNYESYDRLGRVNVSYQQTDLNNYGFSYGYNLANEMTSEVYPSLRTVTNAYDTAGRLASVNGQKTGESNKTYASSIGYAAQGAVSSMTLGNNLIDQTAFNNRLQPTQIKLGTTSSPSSVLQLDYTYSNSNPNVHDNNGNVLAQAITIGSTVMSQSYSYDSLNRLQSASENNGASWSQSYGYDRYGNRWVSTSSGYALSTLTSQTQSAFNTANNRLVASGYDGAGNQTSDAQGRMFTYDAENRQLTFNGSGGQYFYDGDGHRVKKIDSSGTTVFVYNAGGQSIAEYTSGTPSGGGTSYLTSDHLGSTRVVTKADGSVKARYDYLPFGEEIPSTVGGRSSVAGYGGADSTRQKFTQKERDSESGLDYFGARYYGSAQGRFTSVDPLLESGDPEDPQSWHRYCYAYNNPLKYIDPTGGENEPANEEEQKKKKLPTIHFEKLGQVKILGKNVNIYVAKGQTKEYRGTVLKNAQAAADLINTNAKNLTATDRQNIGNVTAIAAPGAGIQSGDKFWAVGIPGVDPSQPSYESTKVESGTFISVQVANAGVDVFASQIGHEGKHIQDYKHGLGAYALNAPRDPLENNDLNERRALRYQLGLYRKLSGSSAGSPDGYDKYLQERIKSPHRSPGIK
jgi:RHS repeat-associated protein